MTFRKTLSALTRTGVSGAAYSISGLIAGPIGAKIMDDAGHASYLTLEAAEAGAAGGAAVGITIGLLKELWRLIDTNCHITSGNDKDFHRNYSFISTLDLKTILVEILLSPATLAAAGAIGHEMLIKVAHMSLEMTVAALAIGQAILAGPFILLGLCCLLCCQMIKDKRPTQVVTQQAGDLQNSFGTMWKREVTNADQANKPEEAPAADSVPAPATLPV